MPEAVLRHPDLPGQPVVLHLAPGEDVALSYKERGWDIDTFTSPADAVTEADSTRQAALEQAAEAEKSWVPRFEPEEGATVDDTPAAPSAAAPAEQLGTESVDVATQPADQPDGQLDLSDPSAVPSETNPQGDSPDVPKE